MVANRAYKFRIYPNDEQKILFAKTFGCVRMVYNHSVGHTGIARICLAYSVIKREPNLPRLGSPHRYRWGRMSQTLVYITYTVSSADIIDVCT